MEPRFKTIYENRMIDCEISTAENLVFLWKKEFFSAIGKYKPAPNAGLPLLNLYFLTGYNDKNCQPICCGHVLNVHLFDLKATVVWRPKKAGFYLDFGADFVTETNKVRYWRMDNPALDYRKIEAIGHVDLLEVK